jgi:hypothetical protein
MKRRIAECSIRNAIFACTGRIFRPFHKFCVQLPVFMAKAQSLRLNGDSCASNDKCFGQSAEWASKSYFERKIQASPTKTRNWTEKREIGRKKPRLFGKSLNWTEKSQVGQKIFGLHRTAANWTKTHHVARTGSLLAPEKAVCRQQWPGGKSLEWQCNRRKSPLDLLELACFV